LLGDLRDQVHDLADLLDLVGERTQSTGSSEPTSPPGESHDFSCGRMSSVVNDSSGISVLFGVFSMYRSTADRP